MHIEGQSRSAYLYMAAYYGNLQVMRRIVEESGLGIISEEPAPQQVIDALPLLAVSPCLRPVRTVASGIERRSAWLLACSIMMHQCGWMTPVWTCM